MKNEAGLRPMKRAFGTRKGYRALRFTATKLPLHASRRLVLHIRAANASFFDSEVFRIFIDAFRAFRVCSRIRTGEMHFLI
jgi:hypothetical protein